MKWEPWILASFLQTCMQMIDGKPTRQLTYLLYEYQCPPPSQNVLQFKPNMPRFYYNPAKQFEQAIQLTNLIAKVLGIKK